MLGKRVTLPNCITVCAGVNPKAAIKRHQQGWVDELIDNMQGLVERVRANKQNGSGIDSFIGNNGWCWKAS